MNSTYEEKFLSWIANNEMELLSRIPDSLFSKDGKQLKNQILSGKKLESPAFTKEEAKDYLRHQLLALLGREVGKSQKSGDFSRIKSYVDLLDDCLLDFEKPPVFEFGERIPEIRETIPTGIGELDEQIGGISLGDLGVIAAPPGRGKTLLLLSISVHALFLGKSVLYISVADQGFDELAPRIATCILGEPLPLNYNASILEDRHKRANSKISGRLQLSDFTSRECSLNDIERVIRSANADIVIVDHADDVINAHTDDLTITRHSLRVTYVTLKKLATKYGVGIWTGSQSHEYLWRSQEGSTADLAESKVGKASPAALIIVLTDSGILGVYNATLAKARRTITRRVVQIQYDHRLMTVW